MPLCLAAQLHFSAIKRKDVAGKMAQGAIPTTLVQFPAPTSDSSQPTVILAPVGPDALATAGSCTHVRIRVHTHTHKVKNKNKF